MGRYVLLAVLLLCTITCSLAKSINAKEAKHLQPGRRYSGGDWGDSNWGKRSLIPDVLLNVERNIMGEEAKPDEDGRKFKSRDYGNTLSWGYESNGGSNNAWPRKRKTSLRDVDNPANEDHKLKSRDYGNMLNWGYGGGQGSSNSQWPKKRTPLIENTKKTEKRDHQGLFKSVFTRALKRGNSDGRWQFDNSAEKKSIMRDVDNPANEDHKLKSRDYGNMLNWGYGGGQGSSNSQWPKKRTPLIENTKKTEKRDYQGLIKSVFTRALDKKYAPKNTEKRDHQGMFKSVFTRALNVKRGGSGGRWQFDNDGTQKKATRGAENNKRFWESRRQAESDKKAMARSATEHEEEEADDNELDTRDYINILSGGGYGNSYSSQSNLWDTQWPKKK